MAKTIYENLHHCVNRESNPGHLLGRQIFYLYTINATFDKLIKNAQIMFFWLFILNDLFNP